MATKKKLLQAAAGTAAASGGAGGLNVEDVFSTYLYEGNGSVQVIDNGINLGQSNSGGGIYFPDGDGDYLQTATLPALSGEFTIELWFYSYDADRAIYLIGNGSDENNFVVKTDYLSSSGLVYITVAGTSVNGNASSYYDIDGWNHLAITRNSSNVVSSYVNGSRIGTATISGNLNSTTYNIGAVGGGTVSASGYELMYGYMSSVRISDTARYDPTSTSLTVPTSAFTSDSNTVLLVGQGDTPLADASSNSYSVTVNGNPRASEVGPFDAAEAGEGGMVWMKRRDATQDHNIFDTERGAYNRIKPNLTDAQNYQSNGLTSFNSNGWSMLSSGNINQNGYNYASWTFRKAPKFFDVVEFTVGSTGTDTIINHSLGSDVGMVITKITSTTSSWGVHHRDLVSANEYMFLNTTSAAASYDTVSFSSTQVDLGTFWSTNFAGETGIAYIFAHNDGDGEFGPDGDADIIKCGSYTGTGSAGNFIDLGFEPQWLLVKATNSNQNWEVFDNMRGAPTGGNSAELFPNTSSAEREAFEIFNFTPTGFETVTTLDETNASGYNYIYIAIRRGPMAVPEDATDVFDVQTYTGNGTANRKFTTGFAIDTNLILERDGGLGGMGSRLIDGMHMTSSTDVSYDSLTDWIDYDYNDGFELPQTYGQSNSNGESYVTYSWQRRPNYFDVVTYTGNGTLGHTVSHNLGVAPEMMWVKRRDSADIWTVYHSALGAGKRLKLHQTTAAEDDLSSFNNTAPTSSVFTVGSLGQINGSGGTYIAYLFASLDGVSKVGSFTAGSSDTFVDCGFSSSARFVLMKRSSGTGDWFVYDSERGYAAGFNDKRLKLNTTGAETTNNNIDPTAGGFTATGNTIDAGTYIFYAIA